MAERVGISFVFTVAYIQVIRVVCDGRGFNQDFCAPQFMPCDEQSSALEFGNPTKGKPLWFSGCNALNPSKL